MFEYFVEIFEILETSDIFPPKYIGSILI